MIREARFADCEAARQLICALEGSELPRENFAEIFRRQCAAENYRCLILEREGAPIGLLNLRFEEQLHHAGVVAEILEFVVAPGHRGQGLGTELLRQAEALARERGCVQIEAASNRRRAAAHRFYTREGFENSHYKLVKCLEGGAL